MNIIHRDLNSHNCLVREVSSGSSAALGSRVCWRKKRPICCSSQGFHGTRGQVNSSSARGRQNWVLLALPFITRQQVSDPPAAQGFNRSDEGKLNKSEKPQPSLQHSQTPPEVAQATQAAATSANQHLGRGIWAGFWKRRLGRGISVEAKRVRGSQPQVYRLVFKGSPGDLQKAEELSQTGEQVSRVPLP